MTIKEQLLYEDKHIFILCKKIGQLSQPDKNDNPNLKNDLEIYLIESGQRQKSPFIGVIHRLDRPVGGVMVYGKTKEGTALLNKQLQSNGFKKEYLAVVRGRPTQDQGTLIHTLLKNQKLNQSAVVDKDTPKSKEASLSYECLQTVEHPSLGACTLIKVQLHTGRHHQIRVQFAAIGHPILGDNKYGPRDNQPLGLWAYSLALQIPFEKSRFTFTKPPSDPPFTMFTLEKHL